MFPTSGLFQDLLCPAFADGNCERPYCHFSHFNSRNPTDNSLSVEKKSTKSSCNSDPIYKPTPISILEKRTENNTFLKEKNSENFNDNCCSGSIPVYQPTPISELDKYAPSSLANFKIPSVIESKIPISTNKPTYSPVTISKSLESNSSNTTFLYQPSPAYTPITEKSCPTNAHEVIDINIDSESDNDDDNNNNSNTNIDKNESLLGKVLNNSFSVPKDLDSQVENSSLVKSTKSDITCSSFPNKKSNFKRKLMENEELMKKKNKIDQQTNLKYNETDYNNGDFIDGNDENDLDDDVGNNDKSEGDNRDKTDIEVRKSLKRQKILSLYQDLYGNPDSENSTSNLVKSHTNQTIKSNSKSITPYFGPTLSKVSKSNTVIDNTNVKSVTTSLNEVETSNSTQNNVPRPRYPLRKSDKIPMPIRTRYLDQFIEECLMIYDSPGDAYNRALEDEQACHDKATSRMAYLNAVIQRLKSLKAEKSSIKSNELKLNSSQKLSNKKLDNSETISSSSSSFSITVIKSDKDNNEEKLDRLVRSSLLYDQLQIYLLTEDELKSNGYPRPLIKNNELIRGKALLTIPQNRDQAYASCKSNERVCCRCGTRFLVNEYGEAVSKQECVYHWGKPIRQRISGRGLDLRYLCCQGDLGQPGCQICSDGHVHDANKWLDDEGFVTALPPLPSSCENNDENENDKPPNVYALDCEMIYTTGGCELGRISIINSKLETVLDKIVHPNNTIIDCNYRFSGLKIEDLNNATDRITDIQVKLLNLFDTNTILIGHSLESDLIALKFIHSKIIDTSILYPHRLGLPKKRALRFLVSDILEQIIQQDDCGHDSMEDAKACMLLIHDKVKKDLRRGKWVI